MSSILSNSIYQHSGETEKMNPIAEQASINEDMEQRRRQLDAQGETRKIIVAKEISNMIDSTGPIHLNHIVEELPTEPLLQQAQNAASSVLFNALETGKSILHSVAMEAELAAGKVAGAVTTAGMGAVNVAGAVTNAGMGAAFAISTATKDAAGYVGHASKDAVGYVGHASKDAVGYVSNVSKGAVDYASHASKDAAGYVSQAAHEAAYQAASIAGKVVDTTKDTASAVGHNALALAEGAANKAHVVADNITYFATLVSVLALEENERARRLASPEESIAASNAFKVSELIRDLGLGFYRQETPNLNYCTKLLEETERRWRLSPLSSSQGASNAHSLEKIVSSNLDNFMPREQWIEVHISSAEEKERSRRIHDTNEIYAILNAFNISSLFYELDPCFYRQSGTFSKTHKTYSTTLLEENERRSRIKAYKLQAAEDAAHPILDAVANNFEKFNYSTRNAARVANEFATKLGSATMSVASALSSRTKELAQSASERVRAVAGDIANFTSIMYIVSLEEGERARRMMDPMEVYAIQNAWKQSGIIRELTGFYKAKPTPIFPIGLLEEHERRWRLANITSYARSNAAARLVSANLDKFVLAQQHIAARELARETAAHSRMKASAPEFVPLHTVKFEEKVAPVIPKNLAAGAQL